MTTRTMLMIIAFAFLIHTAISSAYPYQVEHQCPGNDCVQGQPITWKITVSNDGSKNLRFNTVFLVNAANKSNFTVYKAGEPDPKSSQPRSLFEIPPSYEKALTIEDTVEAANIQDNLTFYLCFTRQVNTEEHYYIWQDISEISYCEKENISIQVKQCLQTSHCRDDAACNGTICIPLICKSCQYTFNHRCLDYECCDSSACDVSESCIKNECTALACNITQAYVNHTCIEANCSPGTALVNNQCMDKGCKDDEMAVGNACTALNCSFDQYAANHICISLNCSKEQGYFNHQCITLSCRANETIMDHQCRALHCNLFEEVISHACVFNKDYLIRFIAEITFLVLIIILFILDVRKVKKGGNKEATPSKFSFTLPKIPFLKR